MAYFTSDDDLEDAEFKMGTVEIKVKDSKGYRDFTIQCGDSEDFDWTIENTGNLPVWLRVTLRDTSGGPLPGDVDWEVTSKNWKQGDDGYWYYKNAVDADKSVTVDFSVGKEEDESNEKVVNCYPGSGGDDGEEEISLEMQAEAIQAEHVETPDWPDEADFR